MKRALVVSTAAVLCYLAVGIGSASALNYVCYWGSDITRSRQESNAYFTQQSSVTIQYGFSCSGQIVVIKTKTISSWLHFTTGYATTLHTYYGGYLASNGQAYYQLPDKSVSCYGVCTTPTLSWAPYVSTNYGASNYSWHGGIHNFTFNGSCQVENYYDPSTSFFNNCVA